MLERTIAISARHQASSDVEKIFITVKCPNSLLQSHRSLLQFMELNIRKFVRTEGIRDYGQEVWDGPAPDNKAIEDEMEERRAAIEERKAEEHRVNREANKLADLRVKPAKVPAIVASGTTTRPIDGEADAMTAAEVAELNVKNPPKPGRKAPPRAQALNVSKKK